MKSSTATVTEPQQQATNINKRTTREQQANNKRTTSEQQVNNKWTTSEQQVQEKEELRIEDNKLNKKKKGEKATNAIQVY